MEGETEKTKVKEDLDMSKKPENEVAVFGLGVLLNHQKELVKQNRDIIAILRYLENKVEALMDDDAQKRLENIKRRF